jgi:hypothetical protein
MEALFFAPHPHPGHSQEYSAQQQGEDGSTGFNRQHIQAKYGGVPVIPVTSETGGNIVRPLVSEKQK